MWPNMDANNPKHPVLIPSDCTVTKWVMTVGNCQGANERHVMLCFSSLDITLPGHYFRELMSLWGQINLQSDSLVEQSVVYTQAAADPTCALNYGNTWT